MTSFSTSELLGVLEEPWVQALCRRLELTTPYDHLGTIWLILAKQAKNRKSDELLRWLRYHVRRAIQTIARSERRYKLIQLFDQGEE